jgi:hypothetical protein|mmetsp:Transcript_66185/g.110523  ORF Transcript_66185/g.110523 Transcript_66185/m.110523 type:complete len:108 (+) Transcript_66185:143-466(+)|eukprot:CAMPEP_0174298382 /NCGR_PEP_ID=MMETSP0809-20121228/53563_1 /TAXON_ID=73025 ORGANISM="Eutreptiella gymnastica-like, Strain CCMP1594" /NCGR_SAMPLE_ID=MMETSP0809 /ASSEMBLY_ACC=CAM_ASM_000658 /LENGTH=107 /DNA_ID=CAMNT_0015402793 /DNA_START=144 /DNA_END=467 /DNA_ORIENTATION=-
MGCWFRNLLAPYNWRFLSLVPVEKSDLQVVWWQVVFDMGLGGEFIRSSLPGSQQPAPQAALKPARVLVCCANKSVSKHDGLLFPQLWLLLPLFGSEGGGTCFAHRVY